MTPEETKLASLRELYDEHEVRAASYLERDLNSEERFNLATEGLAHLLNGEPAEDFEKAVEALSSSLQAGETVGHAIVQAVEAVQETGDNHD